MITNLLNPYLAIHSGEKPQVLKAGRYSNPDCYPNNLLIDSGRLTSPDSEPLKNVTFHLVSDLATGPNLLRVSSQLGEIKYLI